MEQISREFTDAESRNQARRAITQFAFSEWLLSRIAIHLKQGLGEIDAAHAATRQVIT